MEVMNETIVGKNLELMCSKNEGGMYYLLGGESIGGNAGKYVEGDRTFSCAGANFLYDAQRGEIMKFTNYEFTIVPGSVEIPKHLEGKFRVAVDFDKPEESMYKIIKVYLTPRPSKKVIGVILKSLVRFNKRAGW